ncbi:peptidoglycan bridge formation glycyltransferase FemA/FemB family protein [Planococcus plakortidis]|uniref:peptidoglycan bridge formation glycyltransferase FemA/FemB family protein n=1 Tax=Planococcus plakortidis TaxID=1038856 RepID=UPI0039849B53
MDPLNDLFFEEAYGKLYERMEHGVCEEFVFQSAYGEVRHLFIKREIPMLIHGERWYDAITPYGYGGPRIIRCATGCHSDLVTDFELAFREYCKDQRIVSEFVRFHPIFDNARDFSNCYEVTFQRETVGTTLAGFDDPVASEFSKSARKTLRRALNAGVTCRITVAPGDLQRFKEIYYETMSRVHADAYYFFDDDYFDNCLLKFADKIVLAEAIYEGQVIAAELHFLYEGIMHTHLSGTVHDFHQLSPIYVLQYGAVRWGKENGVKLIHTGGGRTNDAEDPLYKFKKKFGQHTGFRFYTGRKIWNAEIYGELCKKSRATADEPFFPAYRANASKQLSSV